jgi:uncharacterized membrane protein YdjX (TVP38/TMEM64 family)
MTEDPQETIPHTTATPPWKRLLPIVVIAIIIVLFFAFDLGHYLSFEMLRDHREDLMAWYNANQIVAIVSFSVLYALIVACSVPGATWMTLAGGFMFGTVLATGVVVISATIGALGIFLIARYALADYFREKAGKAGSRMEEGFQANALSYMLFLRLVPLFPFWLVNLVPAFLHVRARTFAIGTFVGIIPGSAVFCSVGNGLGAVFEAGGEIVPKDIILKPEILMPIIGLAVLSLVPIVYKKMTANKA